MAYNEIRTINNIQLEDIKARQSIQELDNKKANKSDIVSGLNFKGTTTYSALPTSNNNIGDFYYVTDGDGTNGEGNYAWNGTAWYFSGKTTDFGDISTKANTAVNNAAFEEGKLKVTKNDGGSTETEVVDSSLTKSGKAADAKITGDEIGQLKEDFVYKLAEIEISKHSGVDQGYLNKNGVVISHVRFMTTDYIECVPNATIKYKLYAIEEISSIISFYDANKKNISNATIKGDAGSVGLADGETEAPYNAAYFKYTYAVDSDNQKISYKKYYILKEAIKSNEDAINVLNDKVNSPDVINSQWQGKKWIAFGTSITDDKYVNQETHEVTGKYTKYLAELSGLILNNQGIAGGTIGSGGAHGGSSDILNRILSTDVSDADLITIEGFVNDFACAVNLGKPGDTENTSIIGALYQAVNYLQSNSHALVVLLTETTGRVYTFTGPVNTGSTVNYCYYTKKESSGLYQSDYNAAIKRFAEWAGCVCIDCGTKSEINCNNPQYLIDHLHHTELGGKQYAQAVWNELKNLHPLKK